MSSTRRLLVLTYISGLLVVTAPSSLLNQPVERLSNGKLTLANCQGTIWHGSATPVLHTSKAMPLHTLNWKIEPGNWLQGKFSISTFWENLDAVAPMVLTLDRKGITLSNLLLPVPAEVIAEFSPFLKPAQFGGKLRIESPLLSFSDNQLQGNATAHWTNASSAMSAVRPLGNYLITFVAVKENIGVALSTESGALQLNGQGSWLPTQAFHFTATAHATPETQDSLTELLNHLGPEITPGVFQISL